MVDNIQEALREWAMVGARLKELYPELAEDEQALVDTLDGETDLSNAIASVVRSAEEDRVTVAALSIRIDEMEERKRRIENRAASKREFATRIMSEVGLKRITAPDFTATLANGQPSVIITDEAALPLHVMVSPPPKPDKKAIAGLLKAGNTVPGATLSNAAPHLTVRRS